MITFRFIILWNLMADSKQKFEKIFRIKNCEIFVLKFNNIYFLYFFKFLLREFWRFVYWWFVFFFLYKILFMVDQCFFFCPFPPRFLGFSFCFFGLSHPKFEVFLYFILSSWELVILTRLCIFWLILLLVEKIETSSRPWVFPGRRLSDNMQTDRFLVYSVAWAKYCYLLWDFSVATGPH